MDCTQNTLNYALYLFRMQKCNVYKLVAHVLNTNDEVKQLLNFLYKLPGCRLEYFSTVFVL